MRASFLSLFLLSLLLGCVDTPSEVWLYTYPVGCTDNIWQQEWVVSHGMNFTAYPHDRDAEVFKEFLLQRNITLLDFASEPYPIPGELEDCTACSCPRGDICHILVTAGEAGEAEKIGFQEPPDEVYCTSREDCIIVEDYCGCEKGGLRRPINRNFKKQWDEHLKPVPACPSKPSDHPYCNKTLKITCEHNQCKLK